MLNPLCIFVLGIVLWAVGAEWQRQRVDDDEDSHPMFDPTPDFLWPTRLQTIGLVFLVGGLIGLL